MEYKNIKEGIFLSRPNRFIANVLIDGKTEVCHVKNTGRCREILKEGVKVYLEKSDNPERKTLYDLVSAVKDNGILLNIDSQAPNKVVYEWLSAGGLFKDITYLKSECTYKNSRFDFYVEREKEKIFIEVKGVTLEKDGIYMFPDAPTERGAKHLNELSECVKDGYSAYVIFVIQADFAKYMTPNKAADIKFSEALVNASESGVKVMALTCDVTEKTLEIKDKVKVILK